MSTTVTGSPQGQIASYRHGSGGQAAPRARRGFRLPRASTTPGWLWLVRTGLVIVCLAWGALATLMVIQHASAAHDVAAADESLSLDAQQMYHSLADADVTAQSQLSTELSSAGAQSAVGGTGPIADAGHTAAAWFAVNQRAQQLDAAHDYGTETQLEIGSGPGTAGTLFGQLETYLQAAINADQAVFASNAAAGSDAFTGLEAGIIVLAVVMAVGCGWGLTRRLAEYR
jgi:hypothetical protein